MCVPPPLLSLRAGDGQVKEKAYADTDVFCVCLCVRACMHFCYLLWTFSGINIYLARTNGPNGDQRPVLNQQNVISNVLVEVRATV